MHKPLTLCLFTSMSLIALAATDSLRWLSVGPRAYVALQLALACISVGAIIFHAEHRLRKKEICTGCLLAGATTGVFSAAVATVNGAVATQFGGTGALLSHIALVALAINALLCLYAYGQLDESTTPAF
jgi:hypothetical protein